MNSQATVNRLAWPALATLSLATYVSVVHAAMSSIVLPDLASDFGVPDDELTWFVTAYVLTFATGTVVYGRLADMFGSRRPLIGGELLFAVAAFTTAAAPAFWPAVAGRAVMGAGATSIPALSIAIIVQSTGSERRGRSLGAIVAAVGAGFATGPLLGAWLTDQFGWRGPLVLTGAGASVAVLATLLFVRGNAAQGQRGFDGIGALLFSGGVLGAVIALNRLPTHPTGALGLAGLALSPVFLVAFAAWIRGRRQPFLQPHLIRRARYLAFCCIGFMVQGMHFGTVVLLPLLWTRYHDLSFIQIGFHFMPGALVLALLGSTGGFIVDRIGVRGPLIVGTWAASNGAIALHIAGPDWGDWQVAGLYAVVAGGYGLANAGLLHGATESLKEQETGAGVGFYTLLFFLGGAVSSAAVGAILRAREGTIEAWSPFFHGMAPEFSDAFIVVAVMSAVAFLIAIAIGPKPVEEDEPAYLLGEAAGGGMRSRLKPIHDR